MSLNTRIVESCETFRENIVNNFVKNFIDNYKICKNLEIAIYNFSIQESNKNKIIKKWDNNQFVNIYLQKLKSIIFNLKNDLLKKKVIDKEIKPQELVFMTHQEMRPDLWNYLIEEKKIRDENKYTPKLEASTDDFTCFKCKSKKCSYYQLQTRSADEPMTTFVSCLECGNRWKC